jgi:hypothetical protein
MTAYLVGVDLAQSQDYTAIAVVEVVPPAARGGETTAHLRHLERLQGVSYVDVATHVKGLVAVLRTPPPLPDPSPRQERLPPHDEQLRIARGEAPRVPPKPDVAVVYDRTGVGAAAGDVFDRVQIDATLVGILIHGGDRVSFEGGVYRAPKRDLVSALIVAFQNGALRIAADLGLAPVLTAELQHFTLKFNEQTAHDSYSAWREDAHDDLVLAVGLAVWFGQYAKPPPTAAPVGIPRRSEWR